MKVRADKPKREAEPDAWMRLVLQGMPAEELRRELASGNLSADESRWMTKELRRKGEKP